MEKLIQKDVHSECACALCVSRHTHTHTCIHLYGNKPDRKSFEDANK